MHILHFSSEFGRKKVLLSLLLTSHRRASFHKTHLMHCSLYLSFDSISDPSSILHSTGECIQKWWRFRTGKAVCSAQGFLRPSGVRTWVCVHPITDRLFSHIAFWGMSWSLNKPSCFWCFHLHSGVVWRNSSHYLFVFWKEPYFYCSWNSIHMKNMYVF